MAEAETRDTLEGSYRRTLYVSFIVASWVVSGYTCTPPCFCSVLIAQMPRKSKVTGLLLSRYYITATCGQLVALGRIVPRVVVFPTTTLGPSADSLDDLSYKYELV
jgi:hypothetical protein